MRPEKKLKRGTYIKIKDIDKLKKEKVGFNIGYVKTYAGKVVKITDVWERSDYVNINVKFKIFVENDYTNWLIYDEIEKFYIHKKIKIPNKMFEL